jgi:glycosyltransferase involved in cell wall biosynthesis
VSPTHRRSGRVLLTISGTIPSDVDDQVQGGRRPRPDYVEMARCMGADLLDVPEARRRAGRFGRLVERVGGVGALLGWVCYRQRRRYDAVFTDGEQVGLPLAALCRLTLRRPFTHVMVVHIMSVPKKSMLYRALRLGRYMSRMIVYSSAQQRYLAESLGFPADRIVLTPFMVDTTFFSTERVDSVAADRPMICTAGLEFRDYPTLIGAARGLDARVVIAAASPWSKRADPTTGTELPANVEVCRLGFVDLRQLYADARLVVMPLHDIDFQAGVTTILEAMAMGRAVVCSRSSGQTDIITDGVTGVFVPPGDSAALRAAVVELLGDPARADRLGAAARQFVVERCDVSVYARRLADIVAGAIAAASR